MQGKEIHDEKLDLNEDLAEMRDETSMDKALLAADVKLYTDKQKNRR